MSNSYSIANILKRGMLSGLIFTLLWSSWAYYVNSLFGEYIAMRAAITQGSFTIVNAFFYTVFMEYMFAKRSSRLSRFGLAFILPNVIVSIVLIGLHLVRETPNISATALPPILIVCSLSLTYVLVNGPRKLILDTEISAT